MAGCPAGPCLQPPRAAPQPEALPVGARPTVWLPPAPPAGLASPVGCGYWPRSDHSAELDWCGVPCGPRGPPKAFLFPDALAFCEPAAWRHRLGHVPQGPDVGTAVCSLSSSTVIFDRGINFAFISVGNLGSSQTNTRLPAQSDREAREALCEVFVCLVGQGVQHRGSQPWAVQAPVGTENGSLAVGSKRRLFQA